jgi:superfamily II DNA helicase RecQ
MKGGRGDISPRLRRKAEIFLVFAENTMALLTEYASFFISPFGETSVADELNAFLRSHRIVNVEKKLIDGERGTGWVFLVEYGNEQQNRQNQSGGPRIDYREVLTPEEYAVFDKLRALRKDLADKAGVPVYTVFTNEHLAAMIKKPPLSNKDLMSIAGIGESRVKQFGAPVIGFFSNAARLPANTGSAENAAPVVPAHITNGGQDSETRGRLV